MTKILLIEDSEDDFILISRYLEKKFDNLEVTRIDNKEDLLNLSRIDFDFNLIITDRSLPQLTGVEVIDIVRSNGWVVPILCVSGTEQKVDKKTSTM